MGVTLVASTGNSGTAATYTPAQLPTAADIVQVPAGVTLTINANLVCNQLQITSWAGGAAMVTSAAGNWSITAPGGVTVNAAATNLATLRSAAGGTLTVFGPILLQAASTLKAILEAVAASTLNIEGDVATVGAGYTIKRAVGASTLNLNQEQDVNLNAVGGNYRYAASASTLNISMSTPGVATAIKYPTSAIAGSVMPVAGCTISVQPLSGELMVKPDGTVRRYGND